MTTFEMASEIVRYKTKAEHYERLLSDVKGVIQIASDNNKMVGDMFARVMKELDANGIVCCYDKRGM